MKPEEVAEAFKSCHEKLQDVNRVYGSRSVMVNQLQRSRAKAIGLIEDIRCRVRPDFDAEELYCHLRDDEGAAEKAEPLIIKLAEIIEGLHQQCVEHVKETRDQIPLDDDEDHEERFLHAVDQGHIGLEPDEDEVDVNDAEEGARSLLPQDDLISAFSRSQDVPNRVESLLKNCEALPEEERSTELAILDLYEGDEEELV